MQGTIFSYERKCSFGVSCSKEKKKKKKKSQFLAAVRNCATGSRPMSVHAYSIYGYFLYDRPYFSTMGTHLDHMGETIRDINLQKEETVITIAC